MIGLEFCGLTKHGSMEIDILKHGLEENKEKSVIQRVSWTNIKVAKAGCFGLLFMDLLKALVSFGKRNGVP